MADVSLLIGGQHYSVACRDGEEAHLRAIARIVDARVTDAKSAVGDRLGDTRQLLLAALLLADELNDKGSGGAPSDSAAATPAGNAVDEAQLARIEALADRIESASNLLVTGDAKD